MSPEDQNRHLGALLLEERQVRKHIACLASKVQQVSESLFPFLEVLQQPWGEDFSHIKKNYDRVSGTNIGDLLTELEKEIQRLGVIQKEIKSIEGAS